MVLELGAAKAPSRTSAFDLYVALRGEAGRHARTATGAAQLPFGAAVQLDLVVRVKHA
jgi:hypothetical protein